MDISETIYQAALASSRIALNDATKTADQKAALMTPGEIGIHDPIDDDDVVMLDMNDSVSDGEEITLELGRLPVAAETHDFKRFTYYNVGDLNGRDLDKFIKSLNDRMNLLQNTEDNNVR